MEHNEVSFFSDGDRIAGYLYTPEDWKPGDTPRPGILVLAGYSGNTQADCTHMMKRLCAEGWFVFGYDYVGFGKSDGWENSPRTRFHGRSDPALLLGERSRLPVH